MRSVTHDIFGEPADVLHFSQIDKPEPKAGEALIKTIMSPIHNHDLWTVRGTYGVPPKLPAIAGSEAIGIVEAVGDGVDESMIGKRVAVAGVYGAWAEYFCANAAGLLPLPDAISDTLGAQLVAMPFSAISLLETLSLNEGDWVIQTAANGAVGKIFAVLAKARGINTLNLVRREEAVTELKALGMENVLSTESEGWKENAKEILGKSGARAAIDSVGGKIALDLGDLLGVEGTLVVFGTATGAPLELSSGALIMKHLKVTGFWGSKVSNEMAAELKMKLIGELVTLAVNGTLQLEAGGDFSFEAITDAVSAASTPGRKGKIMLHP